MRRLLAIALAALAIPGLARAGTAADPEVRDPAGDALWLHGTQTNADWADITAVWYSSARDDTGALAGFRVHVSTVGDASAPDEDALLYAQWYVETPEEEYCWANLSVWRTDADESSWPPPSATLSYKCPSDGERITVLGLLTVDLSPPSTAEVEYGDAGSEVVVTVPLGAFSEGRSRDLYVEGAVLEDTYADAVVLEELFGATADFTGGSCIEIGDVSVPEGCERFGGARPYVLGS